MSPTAPLKNTSSASILSQISDVKSQITQSQQCPDGYHRGSDGVRGLDRITHPYRKDADRAVREATKDMLTRSIVLAATYGE